MPDPLLPRFDREGGTLKVTGDLHAVNERDLRREVEDLLESGEPPFVMDITEVQYRGSSYVRLIAMAMLRVKDEGHDLTVRATERTVRILEMGGLEKLGAIETAPDA